MTATIGESFDPIFEASLYMQDMKEIRQLITDGKTKEAIRLLNEHIASHPEDDEAHYLLGNAYRKEENTRMALNCYLKAAELNPESPAKGAYDMMIRILDFYNKDIYNP